MYGACISLCCFHLILKEQARTGFPFNIVFTAFPFAAVRGACYSGLSMFLTSSLNDGGFDSLEHRI
jgi:hypothetical protein